MGFGLFSDIFDIVKDIVTLPLKVADATIELGSDIKEVVVRDIQNKIEGNPDKEIRTSYDIRNDAQKIISTSNVQYNNAVSQLDDAWRKMNNDASALAQKRRDVYAMIGRAIYTEPVETLPSLSDRVFSTPSIPSLDSFKFHLSTYLGVGMSMREEMAESYYTDAQKYKIEIQGCVNNLNVLKRAAMDVTNAQEEELAMLQTIEKTYMRQPQNTLIACAEILHSITILCMEEVGEHTKTKYQNLICNLRELWG